MDRFLGTPWARLPFTIFKIRQNNSSHSTCNDKSNKTLFAKMYWVMVKCFYGKGGDLMLSTWI